MFSYAMDIVGMCDNKIEWFSKKMLMWSDKNRCFFVNFQIILMGKDVICQKSDNIIVCSRCVCVATVKLLH